MAEEFCAVSVPSSGGKGQAFQGEWMPEQQAGGGKGEEKEVLYACLEHIAAAAAAFSPVHASPTSMKNSKMDRLLMLHCSMCTQYKTVSSQPVQIIAHSLLIIATCNY